MTIEKLLEIIKEKSHLTKKEESEIDQYYLKLLDVILTNKVGKELDLGQQTNFITIANNSKSEDVMDNLVSVLNNAGLEKNKINILLKESSKEALFEIIGALEDKLIPEDKQELIKLLEE